MGAVLGRRQVVRHQLFERGRASPKKIVLDQNWVQYIKGYGKP